MIFIVNSLRGKCEELLITEDFLEALALHKEIPDTWVQTFKGSLDPADDFTSPAYPDALFQMGRNRPL